MNLTALLGRFLRPRTQQQLTVNGVEMVEMLE
jgi:hypothetical protein